MPTESRDDAIGGSGVFHLDHGALARLVDTAARLHDHAVGAGAFKTRQPVNGERSIAGKPSIAIGIGIHTDEVIVGNIGSKQRLEFTHIGDGVNIASRVQALNKEYQTTLLVTGATLQELGGEFETRLIADVTLRGKSKAVPIYEVLSSAPKPAGV